MTETAAPERLVASLTAALDAEEAAAKAAQLRFPGPWDQAEATGSTLHEAVTLYDARDESVGIIRGSYAAGHLIRQDPARTLKRVAAHREIVDRYAETLRDYARTLERASGGPIGNADLDDLEAELPVLRSIVEIIAGIYGD